MEETAVKESNLGAMDIAPKPETPAPVSTPPFVEGVHVCLGCPTYDGSAHIEMAMRATVLVSNRVRFTPFFEGSSSLCQVFNRLWIRGLGDRNKPFTHFAMLHSDMQPADYWLDTLYDEMVATKATVVSAVAAIKDMKGLTSTGLGNPNDEWDYRRVSLTELQKLPDTFDVDGIRDSGIWPPGYFDSKCLLVNTGCMLIDLNWEPWYARDEKGYLHFCFNQDYRLAQWPDGKWCPEFSPEDWQMSRYVARNGGKVVATKKVVTKHLGRQAFPSNAVWGHATDAEIDGFNRERAEAFKVMT